MVTTETPRELLSTDRCDSCGAAAKVIATFINGELLFCGHHAREAGSALTLKAISVYDPDNEINLIR